MRAAGDILKHGVRTALINDIIYGTFPRKAIELKRIAWRSLHIWKNRKELFEKRDKATLLSKFKKNSIAELF